MSAKTTLSSCCVLLLCGIVVFVAGVSGCSQKPRATVEITGKNHDQILTGRLPVVLDFGAPWCSPCVKLSPTLERLAYQYDGQLVLGQVNVDQQDALKREYDIRTLPTLVYLKNGKLVETQTEDFSAGSIQAKINVLLESP